MIATALGVAGLSALAKVAGKTVASEAILFVASVISLALVTPLVVRRGLPALSTQHPFLHLLRGLAGCLAWYLYFLAIRWIPLIDAVLMINTAPLWVPLLLWIWLKRQPDSRLWGGIILGLVGVVLILHPGREVFSPAIFLGLGSGVCLGVVFITVGMLSRTESNVLILFYYFLISSVAAAPLLMDRWPTPDPETWLILILIGLLLAGGQFTVTWSLAKAPASVVSPLYYLSVVFTGLIDWLIWKQVPDWLSLLGAALVIGGGTWTVLVGRNQHL